MHCISDGAERDRRLLVWLPRILYFLRLLVRQSVEIGCALHMAASETVNKHLRKFNKCCTQTAEKKPRQQDDGKERRSPPAQRQKPSTVRER